MVSSLLTTSSWIRINVIAKSRNAETSSHWFKHHVHLQYSDLSTAFLTPTVVRILLAFSRNWFLPFFLTTILAQASLYVPLSRYMSPRLHVSFASPLLLKQVSSMEVSILFAIISPSAPLLPLSTILTSSHTCLMIPTVALVCPPILIFVWAKGGSAHIDTDLKMYHDILSANIPIVHLLRSMPTSITSGFSRLLIHIISGAVISSVGLIFWCFLYDRSAHAILSAILSC